MEAYSFLVVHSIRIEQKDLLSKLQKLATNVANMIINNNDCTQARGITWNLLRNFEIDCKWDKQIILAISLKPTIFTSLITVTTITDDILQVKSYLFTLIWFTDPLGELDNIKSSCSV